MPPSWHREGEAGTTDPNPVSVPEERTIPRPARQHPGGTGRSFAGGRGTPATPGPEDTCRILPQLCRAAYRFLQETAVPAPNNLQGPGRSVDPVGCFHQFLTCPEQFHLDGVLSHVKHPGV